MLVRYYWPNCEDRGKYKAAVPMDAFWVEATLEEAGESVFPYLSDEEEERSRLYARQFLHIAERIAKPPRPCCFLVAEDLSTVDPHPVHYPFHQLWNAYSPFRSLEPQEIHSLNQLPTVNYSSSGAAKRDG